MRERDDGGCGWPRCRRPEDAIWALVERNGRRVPLCEEHLERWFESRGDEREKLTRLLFGAVECADVDDDLNTEEDDMATKKKSVKKNNSKSGVTGEYGRKGSLSELYKRLIMTTKLGNAAIYALVVKQVGEKKAGKPTYAGWYRAWLKAHKFNPPASK